MDHSNANSNANQSCTTTNPTTTRKCTNEFLVRPDRLNVSATNNRKQFSSFILFLTVIILVNLCPFQTDFESPASGQHKSATRPSAINVGQYLHNSNSNSNNNNNNNDNNKEADDERHLSTTRMPSLSSAHHYLMHLETCLEFVKLMFKNPIRLGKRTTRFTQAEARVLGKMAKVWYIKKKIKKLSKKLKKHTIAVPVFTAIPIYEHSYYPQPHVTHVSHGGMHHAAASSYVPALAQVAPAASSPGPVPATTSQQLTTSASNNHQVAAAYRLAPVAGQHHHHAPMYHGPMQATSHHLINSYAPSPPLYVDEAGGLYGTYGNAYGRYDGGYHVW